MSGRGWGVLAAKSFARSSARILPTERSCANHLKGEFMIRGHFSSHLALLVFFGAAVAIAQGPSAEAPQEPDLQTKINRTDTVVVTAPGEFRVEQELQSASLIEQAAGTSPIKSIAQLPSVNFQAADPYGSYEWAVRISVRGFNQNQLGFTLDDIPLGDMSYGNWNGLHISRAITDENVGRVVLSQGTGALETASTSNLGGTLQFYSADPSDKRSVTLNQSFGSFNAYRTFARFESGLLPGHTKFYLSGAYQLTDKWRGQGQIGQNYWQLNGKLVHYVGNSGVLSVFADVSDRREVDYQDVNKVWVQKLGYNWDNYGNWAQSIQAGKACNYKIWGVAKNNYPGLVAALNPDTEDSCDAGYYGGAGLRKDTIGGVSYKQAISDHLTFKITGYGHHNDGRGLWFTPYMSTYADFYSDYGTTDTTKILSPISLRTSEYGINRAGFLTSLAYEDGRNKIEGGIWFEGEKWNLARRFYATSATDPQHSLYSFPSNPFFTQWEYVFNSIVYDIHLQDVYKVNDKFTVSGGFKTEETTTDGELSKTFLNTPFPFYVPGTYAQGKLTSGKPFLPQFGANYKLDKQSEIFGDASYNVRSYQPGGYGFGNSPWGTTQAAFNTLNSTLKPETSWTEEAGYRTTTKMASVQASYFHVNFSNRLLAFANGKGIQGNPSLLNNVGGVTTNGIDGAVTLRLGDQVTLYNGATWNKSTFDSNVTKADGTCLYNDTLGNCMSIKGKIMVDTPEGLYKTSINWHKSGAFINFAADYLSTRYFTYTNDGSVDGRFLTEIGFGYKRDELGAFKDLKAQLNVYNLMNTQYYASVGTNGFSGTDPLSVNNNTLQVGSPRAISGTLTVRF
jgi:iron complex outermembrane receptor protein